MKKNLRTFLILFITGFSFITNGYSQEILSDHTTTTTEEEEKYDH